MPTKTRSTQSADKKPIGRPSMLTAELAQTICIRIAEGASLRTICADEAMPCKATVFNWLASDRKFLDQYARARETQADVMAEEILDIADTTQEGVRTEIGGKDGPKEIHEDMLGHRRLRVDARKWLMSKLAPKKYGDKLTQEMTGVDGTPLGLTATLIIGGYPAARNAEHKPAPKAVGDDGKQGDRNPLRRGGRGR